MRNLLLVAALTIFCATSLKSQENKNKINRVYVFGGGGAALFDGSAGTLGISAVINRKWIGSIGHLNANRKASAPSDAQFRKSQLSFWGLNFGEIDLHPVAETNFTYASFGRYYPANKRVSFILDAGVGVAQGQDYNYYNKSFSQKSGERVLPGVSSNYTVTETEKTSIGFIARAGMDWAFSGGAGMGFDVYYNACTGGISDNIGVNIRLNIGYMPRFGKNAMKQ